MRPGSLGHGLVEYSSCGGAAGAPGFSSSRGLVRLSLPRQPIWSETKAWAAVETNRLSDWLNRFAAAAAHHPPHRTLPRTYVPEGYVRTWDGGGLDGPGGASAPQRFRVFHPSRPGSSETSPMTGSVRPHIVLCTSTCTRSLAAGPQRR